jgi:hypothetical protein
MKKFVNNLKLQAEQNPVAAIVVASIALKAVTGALNASNERLRAQTHAREIDRRIYNSYNK